MEYKTLRDNNKSAYLYDKKLYGDFQEWTILVNNIEVRCEAIRNGYDVWCGYVYYNSEDYIELNINDLMVHGGVTYYNDHKIGFDTSHYHYRDYCPTCYTGPDTYYRTFEYVKVECESLAKQIFNKLKI